MDIQNYPQVWETALFLVSIGTVMMVVIVAALKFLDLALGVVDKAVGIVSKVVELLSGSTKKDK